VSDRTAIRARLADLVTDDDPDDLAFVVRLLRSFPARAPGLLDDLVAAVGAGDAAAAAERAHALKGAAANVGAVTVAGLCAGVEHRARAGSLDGVRADIQQIRETLAGTEPELAAALAECLRRTPGAAPAAPFTS
jgi:HPt (histidine-containing phosphotransfer) domain-containing protein